MFFVIFLLLLVAGVSLVLLIERSNRYLEIVGLFLVAEALCSIGAWESVRPADQHDFPPGYAIGILIAFVGVWLMLFGDDLQIRLTRFIRR